MIRRLGAQQLEPALQVALHRSQRRIQRGRDLLGQHVLLVAENKRGTLRLRKR
jgi:hypothetical protein